MIAFATGGGLAVKAARQGQRVCAPGRWLEHFEKHGAELGYKTSVEYLRGAQRLTAGDEGVQTFVRANGDSLFYNVATNEFAALNREGLIRTYFKPAQGSEYWLRQTGRR